MMEMEKSLELDGVKILQSGWRKYERKEVELYVTTMKVSLLLNKDIVDIDRWDQRDNPEGYQRHLSSYRPKQIAKYLIEEEGIFPSSILLNTRGEVRFESKGDSSGKITIPPEALPLWLVDGQHRLYGLHQCVREGYEDFKDYVMPVIITNLNRTAEVSMFYKINKRQKGVPVDIAERNLRELLETDPELRKSEPGYLVSAAKVLDITEYLNNDPDSPFYDKIYYTQGGRSGRIIKESVMSKAIGKMYDKNEFLTLEDRDKVKDFLKKYWTAVRDLYQTAFGDNKDYNLTRSQGIRSMIYLAGMVYDECRREDNFTYEKIRSVLERLKEGDYPIDDAWWNRESGPAIVQATNERAVEVLYQELLEKIKQ